MPRRILEMFPTPEEVDCPYLSQFDEEIESDLLLMSPGHENVEQFAGDRAIVYDDVDPGVDQAVSNSFTLDGARAELDELIQETRCLNSESLAELLRNRHDLETAQRLEDRTEDDGEGDDVFETLEARSGKATGPSVDLAKAALERENVRGDSLLKLRIVVGSPPEGIDDIRTTVDGKEVLTWISAPDLSGQPVVITSGWPAPYASAKWLRMVGHEPVKRHASSDEKSVWRARGMTVVKTTRNSNPRSGGNGRKDRATRLADAVERAEGERPKVVDSLKMMQIHQEGDLNFARAPSNNEFREDRVGLVLGSTYYGDEWVSVVAAMCDEDSEVIHPDNGRAHSTGDIGAALLEYMRSEPVMQAITRFGREDGVDPTVYVDTDWIPPCLPTVDASDEVQEWKASHAEVVRAINDGAETYREISEKVGLTDRQVRNLCRQLEAGDVLQIDDQAGDFGADLVDSGKSCISINMLKLPEIIEPTRSGLSVGEESVEYPEDGEVGTVQTTLPMGPLPPPD